MITTWCWVINDDRVIAHVIVRINLQHKPANELIESKIDSLTTTTSIGVLVVFAIRRIRPTIVHAMRVAMFFAGNGVSRTAIALSHMRFITSAVSSKGGGTEGPVSGLGDTRFTFSK
jgi:hypothetical protein